MNIVLTGFMGTGKSAVGRLVASLSGRRFIDTDDLIAARSDLSVAEIFERYGEEKFRELEREISSELADKENLVIASGGRLMLDPLNALLLGRRSIIFCLVAAPEVIAARLERDNNRRPLLETDDPLTRIATLLHERQEGYAQFNQVDTGGKTIERVAGEVRERAQKLVSGDRWRTEYTSRIAVKHHAGSYRVSVGRGLLNREVGSIATDRPSALITDENVHRYYIDQINAIEPDVIIVSPPGEDRKTLETIQTIYHRLADGGMDRGGTVLALGGGVIGDLAGFAAATYMRGVKLIQCPTSLLAMVDASVGGKTGFNLPQGKNLVGAFKQPEAVVADLETLHTLPLVEFRTGMAEVVKSALIARPGLLGRVLALPAGIARGSGPPGTELPMFELQTIIVESILIKRAIVEADPFEHNQRRLLNLGHTFGHALERVSGYSMRHGEAVSMGLAAAGHLSSELGYCDKELAQQIENVLGYLGLPTRIPANLATGSILDAMGMDKKAEGGRLRFVLIRDIGNVMVDEKVPIATVRRVLEKLRQPDDR